MTALPVKEGLMKQSIEEILERYSIESKKPFAKNPLAHFITHDFKEIVTIKANINEEKYKVKGSSGQGNWVTVPWLAIFNREITTTATKGYYIVYLFKADMSGVYLSLNQGWTQFREKYGAKKGKEKIKEVSLGFRKLVGVSPNGFSFDDIDLVSRRTLNEGYELGHIYGKEYSKGNIPNDDELVRDLKEMLKIYREVIKMMKSKPYPEYFYNVYKAHQRADDEVYQTEIETAAPVKTREGPQKRPNKNSINGASVWERDPSIARQALEIVNFTCEINISHKTFTSEKTRKNFVEAHHLIPIKFQDKFENSLDVSANIVSLCPNCHSKLHHAIFEEKEEMLKFLFDKRKVRLEKFGIIVILK